MLHRLKNLVLVLSLTSLTTACGNIPLINGMLGIPNSGAINGAAGTAAEDDQIDDASISEYIPDNTETYTDTGATNTESMTGASASASNDIPSDADSEVEVDSGSWTSSHSTGATTGTGAATAPSDGSATGEDTTIPDGSSGVETPEGLLPSGTVDLPVSISKEDDEMDGCTAENEGVVQPVMLTYSSSSHARRSSSSSHSRLAVKDQRVSMNFNRVSGTSQLTLNLTPPPVDTTYDNTSSGGIAYEQCTVVVDEEGNSEYKWEKMDFENIRTLNLNHKHDIVIGTMTPTATGWTQNAIRVPVDENGHFQFSNELLVPSDKAAFNYVGVMNIDDDSDAPPADTLIIQNQPDMIRIDRTMNLNTYIESNQLVTAPSIRIVK